MNIAAPVDTMFPGLRRLWKAAFGDTEEFLDSFFSTAYAPECCRCVVEDGAVAAALYWFDCGLEGVRLAYLYAVATDPAYRGRGLCRSLMADTMDVLTAAGYRGAILVPQEEGLIRMYAGMGFVPCSGVREFHALAAENPIPVRRVDAVEFARLRRGLLPEGGVVQEGENLRFLACQAELYAGEGWTAAVAEVDGTLWCPEFLGDPLLAPGLVKALGYREGGFRVAGEERPFAMFRPLTGDCPRPAYFGFAFD